jgi:hypothetical protein
MSANIPGYQVIPQIQGPALTFPFGDCLILLEDNSGFIELENGRGFIALQTCFQLPAVTFLIELENGSGQILLENAQGYIELEIGP